MAQITCFLADAVMTKKAKVEVEVAEAASKIFAEVLTRKNEELDALKMVIEMLRENASDSEEELIALKKELNDLKNANAIKKKNADKIFANDEMPCSLNQMMEQFLGVKIREEEMSAVIKNQNDQLKKLEEDNKIIKEENEFISSLTSFYEEDESCRGDFREDYYSIKAEYDSIKDAYDSLKYANIRLEYDYHSLKSKIWYSSCYWPSRNWSMSSSRNRSMSLPSRNRSMSSPRNWSFENDSID